MRLHASTLLHSRQVQPYHRPPRPPRPLHLILAHAQHRYPVPTCGSSRRKPKCKSKCKPKTDGAHVPESKGRGTGISTECLFIGGTAAASWCTRAHFVLTGFTRSGSRSPCIAATFAFGRSSMLQSHLWIDHPLTRLVLVLATPTRRSHNSSYKTHLRRLTNQISLAYVTCCKSKRN